MTIINPSLHSNAKRTHLTQTKTAAIVANFLKNVRPSHSTAKKRANKNLWSMSFNGFFTFYLAMTEKTDTLTLNKLKASAADLSKQVHRLCITAKQRAKTLIFFSEIIVKLIRYLSILKKSVLEIWKFIFHV